MKRLIVVALALVLAGVAGAQIVQGPNKIIERLTPEETRGGWVKIDKSPKSPNHHKVYCITVDGMLSCDWNDVRRIVPKVSYISD